MYEIEAKVRLAKADLARLKREVPKIAKREGKSVKKDDYFIDDKSFYLRIRQKENQAILTIKRKGLSGRTEYNLEVEFGIRSKGDMIKLLEKMGIRKTAHKEKISLVYSHKDMQIEINHLVGLGDFLEIEAKTESKSGIPTAKRKLHRLFRQLGFRPSQFEKKYYLQLLQEKSKNK